MEKKTPEQLSAAVRNFSFSGAKRTQERSHPILDGALSSIINVGLSSAEMVALAGYGYQNHMLNALHHFQMQLFSMTFTVEDPDNHQIVNDNLASAQSDYRIRLVYALKDLRRAIAALKEQSLRQYVRARFGCE